MKKFSKEIEAQRQEIIRKLVEAEEEVEGKIKAMNDAMTEHADEVNSAIANYNEVVSDAESFKSDAVAEIDAYTDEKSEKWQEGENGQKYAEWRDNIENMCLDELSFDEPSQVDCPEFGAKAALEEEWQDELG